MADLAGMLTDAISTQTRTVQAKIVNAATMKSGFVTAYSERHGNIKVLCRTNDNLGPGDNIFVRALGPGKYDPYLYSSFSNGSSGTYTPGIGTNVPIYIQEPTDNTNTAPAGTMLWHLNEIIKQIKAIKGTDSWKDTAGVTLKELVTWRGAVATLRDLPGISNRVGDVRYVIEAAALFAYNGTAWQSISAGAAGTGSVLIPNGVTNMAVGCAYVLAPAPDEVYPDRITRVSPDVDYAQSGGLLTDGMTGGVQDTHYAVGWYNTTFSATLDLKLSRKGNYVRVWGISHDPSDILRAPGARLESSQDGETWGLLYDRAGLSVTGSASYERWALEFNIKEHDEARYWRVSIGANGGWLLISEIEVLVGIDEEIDEISLNKSDRVTLNVGPSFAIPASRFVALTNTGLVLADNRNMDLIGRVVGVAFESRGVGEDLVAQTNGVFTFPVNTFAARGTYYVGQNGLLTQTLATTAKFVQAAGQAVSSSRFLINLSARVIALE